MKELLGAAVRGDLEQNVAAGIPAEAPLVRGQGRTAGAASRLAAIAALPDAKGAVVLAEVEADLPGRTERYCLPLAGVEDAEGVGPLAAQLALARLRHGPPRRLPDRRLHRQPHAARRAACAARRRWRCRPTTARSASARPRAWPTSPCPRTPEIRRLSAEQSNSSLIFGEQVVLKIIRRINPGIHPEAEVARYLTEQGFANTAPLLGEVVRIAPDGTPHTLILAQGFVRNQGDGWGWTLDWLARAVDEAALTDDAAGGPLRRLPVLRHRARHPPRRVARGAGAGRPTSPTSRRRWRPRPTAPHWAGAARGAAGAGAGAARRRRRAARGRGAAWRERAAGQGRCAARGDLRAWRNPPTVR